MILINLMKSLDVEKKAALKARLIKDVKTNTFDESSENIKISKLRWEAISENIKIYSSIFSDGHEQYAIPEGALTDEIKLEQLNAFMFPHPGQQVPIALKKIILILQTGLTNL